MEAAEVSEDPSITLARKISSATRQTRRVKVKAIKEEKLNKRLATDGPGGGVGRCGRGGRGGRRKTSTPTVQTAPWPEHYKALYYYAAKQLRTPR